MKKKFAFLLLAIAVLIAIAATPAAMQTYKVWYNGHSAGLTVPELTANKTSLFPTWDYSTPNYNSTVNVEVDFTRNWIMVDSISATTTINLTVGSKLLGGEEVYLQLYHDGTPRTVYVKQGTYVVDTIALNQNNTKRYYMYNTAHFEEVSNL